MKARFEVSTEGMRLLHQGRPLWQLAKELIANSFDEEITTCDVEVNYVGRGLIEIKVSDDGKGFIDIADSYTVWAPTAKRSNAMVRGRFNIGEKELVSIAKEATIETVGHTMIFPPEGGRKHKRNKRSQGTIVTAIVRGKQEDIQPTIDALSKFIPPAHVSYSIGSNFGETKTIKRRGLVTSTEAKLPTVLSATPTEPIRNTTRKTKIDIYQTLDGEEHGSIYEMGILIQKTEMPFDVDINQKVPLPPNRDVVSYTYLQDVYAEVLTVTTNELGDEDFSESWVQIATEDDRTSDEVVGIVLKEKLGENAYLWSSDTQANDRAREDGMDIIHPKSLSKIQRDRFKNNGLVTTSEGYGIGLQEAIPVEPNKSMREVADYAKWLAKELLGIKITIEFIKNPDVYFAAQYGNRNLTFNVGKLHQPWFDNAPLEKHTDLILHELAHEIRGEHAHHGEFIHQLSRLGAKATHKAIEGDWWRS